MSVAFALTCVRSPLVGVVPAFCHSNRRITPGPLSVSVTVGGLDVRDRRNISSASGYQRLRANLGLPVDSPASESSYKDGQNRQNNHPAFKNRKWLAFFSVGIGVFGIALGVYLSYISRADWRRLGCWFGVLVVSFCLFVHGVCVLMGYALKQL